MLLTILTEASKLVLIMKPIKHRVERERIETGNILEYLNRILHMSALALAVHMQNCSASPDLSSMPPNVIAPDIGRRGHGGRHNVLVQGFRLKSAALRRASASPWSPEEAYPDTRRLLETGFREAIASNTSWARLRRPQFTHCAGRR
jgi:hypothetical protein